MSFNREMTASLCSSSAAATARRARPGRPDRKRACWASVSHFLFYFLLTCVRSSLASYASNTIPSSWLPTDRLAGALALGCPYSPASRGAPPPPPNLHSLGLDSELSVLLLAILCAGVCAPAQARGWALWPPSGVRWSTWMLASMMSARPRSISLAARTTNPSVVEQRPISSGFGQ